MTFSEVDQAAQITQLQAQQSLFTQALKAALEGRWTGADGGADSVEAYLYALYPPYQGQTAPDPPVLESEHDDPKAQ